MEWESRKGEGISTSHHSPRLSLPSYQLNHLKFGMLTIKQTIWVTTTTTKRNFHFCPRSFTSADTDADGGGMTAAISPGFEYTEVDSLSHIALSHVYASPPEPN